MCECQLVSLKTAIRLQAIESSRNKALHSNTFHFQFYLNKLTKQKIPENMLFFPLCNCECMGVSAKLLHIVLVFISRVSSYEYFMGHRAVFLIQHFNWRSYNFHKDEKKKRRHRSVKGKRKEGVKRRMLQPTFPIANSTLEHHNNDSVFCSFYDAHY